MRESQCIKNDYVLAEGKIFKRVDDDGQECLLWVVTGGGRWQVVRRCHEGVCDFAVEKTMAPLIKRHWLARMCRYVKRYIRRYLERFYCKVTS